jgi:hypothetical protein
MSCMISMLGHDAYMNDYKSLHNYFVLFLICYVKLYLCHHAFERGQMKPLSPFISNYKKHLLLCFSCFYYSLHFNQNI